MWNQPRIEQYIADGIEESLTLDYKAAGALDKSPEKKSEIQRDVSAFANSAGGTIIYGVREHSSQDKKHLPERIEAISRRAFSKEWLEQVISGIQPRIQGIIIHPVPLNSGKDDCCYVVEIPQSDTAHQVVNDGRYYRRYNFERRFMQDFEVREAMDRSRHPKVEFTVFLNLQTPTQNESYFLINLKNVGRRIARDYLCFVMLPLCARGTAIRPVDPVILDKDEEALYSLRFSLPNAAEVKPLFPFSGVILKREIQFRSPWKLKEGGPIDSIKSIQVRVYADEMEPITRIIPLEDAIKGWT